VNADKERNMVAINIKTLLESGVHFGHQTRKWNPKMKKFIFGARNKIHILDLQKTIREIKRAYRYVKDEVAKGKTVLFVGTKPQAAQTIKAEAERCGAFYVNQRWLGGTLTNFETIKKSIQKLEQLEKMKADGLLDKLSKKEATMLTKRMEKLQNAMAGIRAMKQLPGIVFIVDTVKEAIALREARTARIPVVAVCDTDSDPELIDYPIPANDDAIRSIKLICSIVADAVVEGLQARGDKPEQEKALATEIPVAGPLTDKEMEQPIALGESEVQPS